MDDNTPLRDKAVIALHNRSVRLFEYRMSHLPWSQITPSPAVEVELPTRRTILAGALPGTSRTFHWPELQETRWVVFCPIPGCTTAPGAEKTTIIRRFEEHGLEMQSIPAILRLFGYRGMQAVSVFLQDWY